MEPGTLAASVATVATVVAVAGPLKPLLPVYMLLAQMIGFLRDGGKESARQQHEQELAQKLADEEALQTAIRSQRSIRDEVRVACAQLSKDRELLDVGDALWRLLSDESFQGDLTEWLRAGGIDEGQGSRERLTTAFRLAMVADGAPVEQIGFLETTFFASLERLLFSNHILARWRHQLSLDYLREQVAVLRQRADEAAGIYTPAKQASALDHYCENALATWDIIDLTNLPEGDVQITMQKLLLRQLYMPLRIEVEPSQRGDDADAALARFEEMREVRRRREAGHFIGDEPEWSDRNKSRSPIGKRLAVSHRMVVLGDPGGGKTTMLRWMATAYLLRHKGGDAFSKVPDTGTLPKRPWIPVLIRCRELGEVDLCRCFTDFLTQHLNKSELLPEESSIMRAVILDRIAKGEALLLVDGLDEITNPQVRVQFCQELERTAARYPDAPIVVTSRIVGYRDMPYRMGSGFEHGVIAELNRKDKDLFAQRWVEVTEQHQPTPEKAKRVQELIEALHSSDRIERLTGNPMLLTTLALVKRKVGKLPNRRTKLYAEAVSVLLNWNPRLYQTIEEDEAIPQLEYLAYEMCRRGVQRLTDDEVLELLENLRVEYPKIRAVRSREPREFLKHLEQRSSILIRSGGAWQKNNPAEKPVWEFRHLTFQEYLAARALLDGRYPARGKPKSLAEQVAPLAGAMETVQNLGQEPSANEEVDVPESWREALRLLVADCKDDDVDDVLLAILNPLDGEDVAKTGRPRAVLAALCLADEPNVSEENATLVLGTFAAKITQSDGNGPVKTSLDRAALEVAGSIWSPRLKLALIQEFVQRPSDLRFTVGGLWGMAEVSCWKKTTVPPKVFIGGLIKRLKSGERVEVISAALSLMEAAFEGRAEVVEGLSESLLVVLTQQDLPASHAAAWALGWLSNGSHQTPERKSLWIATGAEVDQVGKALEASPPDATSTRRWLAVILGFSKDRRALPHLLRRLSDQDAKVRLAVIEALVQLGDIQAVVPLLTKLEDQVAGVRRAAIEALARLGEKQVFTPLLAKLDDQDAAVRRSVIAALVRFDDKQAVVPLLAKLDDEDAGVRTKVVEALGKLGDKQAVVPLLAKLNDEDADVREEVVEALGKLGDKQAVVPLLAKLDDQAADVRTAVIEALGQLADKQAVVPLLAKLDHQNADVRRAVIGTLGQLGDHQAIAPLLTKLDGSDTETGATTALALHKLGEQRGTRAWTQFYTSEDVERRLTAVRAYARPRDASDKRLLSRDSDAMDPWLDPQQPITESQVVNASQRLNITPEQVRFRYEAMAADLSLKLSWRI